MSGSPCVLFRRGGRFLRRQGEGGSMLSGSSRLGVGLSSSSWMSNSAMTSGAVSPSAFLSCGATRFWAGRPWAWIPWKALRQVVEREGRPAQLFSQQGPPLADKRDPRDAEGHLKGDEQQEQPDQGRPHRTEQGGELGIELMPSIPPPRTSPMPRFQAAPREMRQAARRVKPNQRHHGMVNHVETQPAPQARKTRGQTSAANPKISTRSPLRYARRARRNF